MRLAVIPARAGSKRIPGKNTRDFLGKPIILYTIGAAKGSGVFDRIVVCTDSNHATLLAAKEGIDALPMPKNLAGDNAPVIDVVRHVAKKYKDADTVALLYACQPFMDGAVLQRACESFESGNRDRPLLSVNGGDGLKSDAGMFCFYHAGAINRGGFRFFNVPGAVDINTESDWCLCINLFTEREESCLQS